MGIDLLPDAPAPRWAPRAAIGAATIAILLAYLSAGALGIGTADRDHASAPVDSPWLQTLLPAMETPFNVPWSASVAATRASWSIARGRRTAPRDAAATASAFAAGALAMVLLETNLAAYPILIAMLAMAAGSTFWSRGVGWTPDALSPALALIALRAGWRWLREPHRRGLAAIAVVTGALALAEEPAWLAVLPAAAAFSWRRLSSSSQRLATAGAIAIIALVAWWPISGRVTTARNLAWAADAGVQPPGAFELWAESVVPDRTSAPGLVAHVMQEFTPLGAALAMIGVGVLCRERRDRLAIAAAAAGLAGWFWWAPRSGVDSVSVPLAVLGWAAVAVALGWLAHTVPPRAGRTLVAVVGVMLIAEPTLTRVRLRALGRDRPSEEQARMAYDFRLGDLPPDVAIISESRRVDQTLLVSARRSGRPARLIPQTEAPLQSAIDRGLNVIAFANARTQLKRLGFIFERAWIGGAEVHWLTGRSSCVDLTPGAWPDVSLLLAGGSFVLYGATATAPPGGVIMRLTDPRPIRVASIEPRSIPFEIGPVPHDAAVGIGELDRAAARSGVPQVVTLRVRETGRAEPVTLTLASPPQAAVAAAESPTPVRLCAVTSGTSLTLGRADAAAAVLPLNAPRPFGSGWHSPEADPQPFRWTAAASASVRVTLAPPGAIRVAVTAMPAARPAQRPALGLAVNECQQRARPMPPGPADYEWDVPASCWRAGFNQMWLETGPLVTPASLGAGPDTRPLGARIAAIRLARIAPAQNAK